MWGIAKALFVVLSVTVNGAFVAAWVTHRVPAESPAPCEQERTCCLREKLNASDAQWQKIEPRLAEFRKTCQAQCCEINRLRSELIDLIAAPKPDQRAIRTKQDEILQGQRKMQELVVEQLLGAKEVLTPAQQRTLFELIRTRCGCSSQDGEMGCGGDQEIDCGNCLPEGPGDNPCKPVPQRRSS